MVDLFFHIFNTIVLVYAVWYLFHRYLYDKIAHERALDTVYVVNLSNRYDQAKKQENTLLRAAQHQQSVSMDLTNKVKRWQQEVARMQSLESDRIAALTAIVCEREQQQHMLYARQLCARAMQPHVYAAVQQELQEWSHKQQNQLLYLDSALRSLEASSQYRSSDNEGSRDT